MNLLPKATNHEWDESVDTPAVLIDLDVVERNIVKCQNQCDELGLSNRPHIKTHKLPLLAHAQLSVGAIGITCQKIGEAEVMADAGVEDILISYNIIGRSKLGRLHNLADRVKITVCADNSTVVKGLSEHFREANFELDVLVEYDTGMHRCGVSSPSEAVALAKQISDAPGLNFAGLLSYPAAGEGHLVAEQLLETQISCNADGLDAKVMSSGGTPDLYRIPPDKILTEYRPGSYIYNDRSLVNAGACSVDECALSVLTTVVSCPSPDRAIVDAGSKSLTSDLFGMQGYGIIANRSDISITSLSEEHGHLHLDGTGAELAIGQMVRIIPNHACVVSNMVDEVTLIRGQKFVSRKAVVARGKVS